MDEKKCEDYNKTHGRLDGYDCPDCLNRGNHLVLRSGEIITRECHCMETRRSLARIAKSGLGDMLEDYTLDNYSETEAWQKRVKQSAVDYLYDWRGNWFYAGGQSGSGKTHVCTAIVGEFLKRGMAARYMLWRDEVVQLKACVNDDVMYSKIITPLKTVEVLYIDDLFKTARGIDGNTKPPTQGDLNVAFEIINYRYNNKDLITILSSEYYVNELLDVDEAIGSRIYERTKRYCNNVKRDKQRNYRTR